MGKDTPNILSSLTFCYTLDTFRTGFVRDLDENDLNPALIEHQSELLGDQIERLWTKEIEKANNQHPSLNRILIQMFGWRIIFFAFVLIITESLKIIQPLALGQLLDYYEINGKTSLEEAYLYAGLIVFCSLINTLFSYPYMMGLLHLGMKIRIATTTLIYRKLLRLDKNVMMDKGTNVGQMVNLLANDAGRFDLAVMYLHDLWMGPVEIVVCSYLMYQQIGVSALIGIAFIALIIPIQVFLGNRISDLRLKTALKSDKRLKLMNEIISGIQIIKMYAWEKSFAKLIGQSRLDEIKPIKNTSLYKGITSSFTMYVTRISIFASMVAMILIFDEKITAEKAFVVTSFYSLLLPVMTVFFPQGVTQLAETIVSVRRLNDFLLYDEIASKHNQSSEQNNKIISLNRITARWNKNSKNNTLSQFSLEIAKGKLTAVIGAIGSGKSSLFQVILNELPVVEGQIELNGTLSYAAQEAWLFRGTIRQNILLGSDFVESRYNRVIEVCALEKDFHRLPYGDMTFVSDRGVSLSGGQKARINLARAIYRDADIYLLDDPLSAVDSHVGRQIFNDCILDYLRDKTVVLITHQLQYLADVEHVVYLQDGHVKQQGSFKSLQDNNLDFLETVEKDEEADKSDLESLVSSNGTIEIDFEEQIENKELRSRGSISFRVYVTYLKSAGNWCLVLLALLFVIITQTLIGCTDYIITFWVNIDDGNTEDDVSWNVSTETIIYIYTGMIILLVTITIIRTFTFFTLCMKASIRLHNNLFVNVIRATLKFFNTNTSGRIMNRFSKDIGIIDELLPSTLMDCLQIGFNLFGSIIIIGIVHPLLIAPTLVMVIIFYILRIFYIRTSRSLKRLEGLTRSPIYSHVDASFQGLETIRAFEAQKIFRTEFDKHQDLHSSAFYAFLSTTRAFGYWLDLICVAYVAFVTFSFVSYLDDSYPGNVGLAITQAISLTGMFQWFMKQTAELENQATSIERITEYNAIEQESWDAGVKPPENWPVEGQIQFKHFYLYYSIEDKPTLKNLNFVVKPREKIGIVGRTGAGKSSLINALFRLNSHQGLIEIDGLDIAKLNIEDLRKNISIIPQEPILFSGTIRSNLDPFDNYTDEELWKALDDVKLKNNIINLNLELDAVIMEGGANFSVGQRQLICLARAILRQNKILILDEATANVDPQTDVLIQRTIREKFGNCTVLTVAHRLHTVMDSDRILVVDDGMIKQYDHPYRLLQDEHGLFYDMVKQTGVAKNLYRIAEDHFDQK